MDEVPVDAGVGALLHRLPPALVRHLDHRAAEPPDRIELGLRRVLGCDDRGGHAQLAGHPGDALRHVAGARRQHAAIDRAGRRRADRVGGAADLERADRLQALELEPDLGRRLRHLQPDQRRAQHDVGDALARSLDVGERDQKSTSTPTPRSRARATQSCAAARSSTAIPIDLNTVSSSADRRPSTVPLSSSPSSPMMCSGPKPLSAAATR